MPTTLSTFQLAEDRLRASTALAIARGLHQLHFPSSSRERVHANWLDVRAIVESGRTVYGINTGFGVLCDIAISAEDTSTLQANLLKSHSVGVGEAVPLEVAKLMLILKAHALAQGYSGIAVETIERILWHVAHDCIPLVPAQGSVGASGDLAPLSHLFLPLIGLGKVHFKGQWMDAGAALQSEGLQPLSLGPKEGLGLINGTQFIAAFATVAVDKLANCLDTADLVGAMSLEAVCGLRQPFDPALHQLRPFVGARLVAHRLAQLLADSGITPARRVQDPYSFRCMPQVHGASREAWLHLRNALEIELNAVTDNPIVFSPEKTISGGNFHGQLLALPLDYAGLAASELGNISDRRAYAMLEERFGLPRLLVRNTGLNSGFMIPQYTMAALASENKSLCYPASADSIPTSMGQEDHVSMGSISGRKTLQIIQNVEKILGIELMMAAQGLDFRRPERAGSIIEAIHQLVREEVDFVEEDRIFGEDMDRVIGLVREGLVRQTALREATARGLHLHGQWQEQFDW